MSADTAQAETVASELDIFQCQVSIDLSVQLQNQIAGRNWKANNDLKVVWKDAGYWAARQHKIPSLRGVELIVSQRCGKQGRLPDIASCMPSVKAFIDGLQVAKVFPDDSRDYLSSLTFNKIERSVQPGLDFQLTGTRA